MALAISSDGAIVRSCVQKAVKAHASLTTTILTMLSSVGSRVSAQAIVVAVGLMICGLARRELDPFRRINSTAL
jgi:aerobic-type carbon monoxide dehydrogenase small subunit (CoxS/CutS family)